MELKNKIVVGALMLSLGTNAVMYGQQNNNEMKSVMENSQAVVVVEQGEVVQLDAIKIDPIMQEMYNLKKAGWKGEASVDNPSVLVSPTGEQEIFLPLKAFDLNKFDKEGYDYTKEVDDKSYELLGKLESMKDSNGNKINPELIEDFISDYYEIGVEYAKVHNIDVSDGLDYLTLKGQGFEGQPYDEGVSVLQKNGEVVVSDSPIYHVEKLEEQSIIGQDDIKEGLIGAEFINNLKLEGKIDEVTHDKMQLEFKDKLSDLSESFGSVDNIRSQMEFNIMKLKGFEGEFDGEESFTVMKHSETGELHLINHVEENIPALENDLNNNRSSKDSFQMDAAMVAGLIKIVEHNLQEAILDGKPLPKEFVENSIKMIGNSFNKQSEIIEAHYDGFDNLDNLDNVNAISKLNEVTVSFEGDLLETPNGIVADNNGNELETPAFGVSKVNTNAPDVPSIYKKPSRPKNG